MAKPTVMVDEEFKKYLKETENRVEEWKEKGWDNNSIRCGLMGQLENVAQALTGEQLKRIFDLGFMQREND